MTKVVTQKCLKIFACTTIEQMHSTKGYHLYRNRMSNEAVEKTAPLSLSGQLIIKQSFAKILRLVNMVALERFND